MSMTDILIESAEELAQEESVSDEVFENKLGTVAFTAKRTRGQYQSDEVAIFLPFEFTTNSDLLSDRISEAFAEAKSHVYLQLGANYQVNPETTVVEEVEAAFPGATTENPTSAPSTPSSGQTSGRAKIIKVVRGHDGQPLPEPAWFQAEAAKYNESEWWDERSPEGGGVLAASGKSKPWFKAKTLKNDKGYQVGIYPPRGA